MKSIDKYIDKANELFAFVGGDKSEMNSSVEKARQHLNELLMEVTENNGFEPKQIKDCGSVDIELLKQKNYRFLALLNEFHRYKGIQLHGLKKNHNLEVNSPLGDDATVTEEEEILELISKLIVFKSGKYVVITKNMKVINLIQLINEVFYDTESIKIIQFATPNLKDVSMIYYNNSGNAEADNLGTQNDNASENAKKNTVVKMTGWDTLD